MQTILMPIQGELPRLLGASPSATAWVITVTLLSSAISVPISGKLGDMYGKRAVALVLLGVLFLGSLVCALAPGLGTMILGRALQGLGMGIIPLGISLLGDVVDTRRLGTAIALVSATLGVGAAIGLPVSAVVVQNADWHVLFLVAAALALINFVLVYLVVPDGGVSQRGRIDVVGVIGLTVGLSGILLAVSQGNVWGWNSAGVLGCLIGGLIVLVAWAGHELRIDDPLVDLRVSVRRTVLTTNLASVAMGFALFASSVAFPQLLQLPGVVGGLGLDLLSASLVLVPAGLAMLVMSPIAGRVGRTAGPRPLLIAGAMVITAAYLVCLFMPLQVWTIVVANIVIGAGVGLGYAAMPALIMGAVPKNEIGSANGVNTLMRSFGTTAASVVAGAIIAASAGDDIVASFSLIFILGLVAATVCTVIGFFIPRTHVQSRG